MKNFNCYEKYDAHSWLIFELTGEVFGKPDICDWFRYFKIEGISKGIKACIFYYYDELKLKLIKIKTGARGSGLKTRALGKRSSIIIAKIKKCVQC